MRILNVRLGHACNSSSSHSIIWFDGEAETDETQDFGWSYFTAANTEARRNYAALLVASRVTRTFNSLGWEDRGVLTKAYVRDVLGVKLPKGAYIDHESGEDRFNLPTHADGTVHSEFAKEFVKWFSRAPIAVLGGNDNDEETHPLDHAGKPVPFVYGFNGIARKDPAYGFWTVFDPKSGNKIRVDFETATGPDWVPPTRGSAPELVDLKITDYCPYGCAFCLDPSTPILKSDLTWQAIGSITTGDTLLAFEEKPAQGTKTRDVVVSTVVGVRRTQKPSVRVVTDRGTVICSQDHRWLMSNTHRWLQTKDLKLGHAIMFSTAPWSDSPVNDDYRRGYLSGLSCGDGTARWEKTDASNQIYWSVRMRDREAVDRAFEYAVALGCEVPSVTKYDCAGHWMWRVEARSQAVLTKLRPIITLDAETAITDYKRGWLAGFFDAEGSFAGTGTWRFSQKKTDMFLDIVERWLSDLGFASTKVYGSEVRLRGGRWAATRLAGVLQLAITRKLSPLFEGGIKNHKAVVLGLESLPEQELVDIETSSGTFIANGFASHNCYMGSTTRGQHADREWVQKAATELANMGVFEVAIGGGEPTLHPEFERIVADLKQHNMNVNFTTKNLSWLRDPVRAKAITESCSAFAYSVDTGEDVRALSDAWRASPYRDDIQAVAQVVVGGVESYFFEDILKECKRLDIPVTLLGFKTTGRGEAFKQKVYDWKALVRKAGLRRVGIDTVLAATLDVTDKVDSVFYHKHEGAWSMYVDAVERKAGPSSYCDENAKVSVEKFYPHDKERKWPLCGPLLPVFQGFEIPK